MIKISVEGDEFDSSASALVSSLPHSGVLPPSTPEFFCFTKIFRNMKNFLIVLFLLFVAQISFAQQDWAELDAFHKVMSQTFHPAEDGNMQPIMTRSAELAMSAKTLMKSKVPADLQSKGLKTSMKNLVKQTANLNKMVKKGKPEAEIKTSLFAVHETFHEIMGQCKH